MSETERYCVALENGHRSDQFDVLLGLLASHYAIADARLEAISPYMLDDRGIYRVTLGGGDEYVLRAFRSDDAAASLCGQVAVLAALERCGYRAPHVRQTRDGAALAAYEGWTALLLSYLPGEVADFSVESLTRLGASLGAGC